MKIIFAGTPEFAVTVLRALLDAPRHTVCAVYTQPDRPAGRGRKLAASPVAEIARARNLPLYQPLSLRDESVQRELAKLLADTGADVIVNVAYGLFFPDAVLAAPRFGCLNVHPSLLPRWRGASPVPRAILAGDAVTGVTIMQMDSGLDTGPIVSQSSPIAIAPTDTSATLLDKLALIGGQLLLSALDAIETSGGVVRATLQDVSQSTYAGKLTKDEARIDWACDAAVISRAVRAFNPQPIAHTEIAGECVRIWEAVEMPAGAGSAVDHGVILRADKQGIDVATGSAEALRITKLQLPGGKALLVRDLLNSPHYRQMFAVGICLGRG